MYNALYSILDSILDFNIILYNIYYIKLIIIMYLIINNNYFDI